MSLVLTLSRPPRAFAIVSSSEGVPYYLELAQLYLGSLLGNKDYFDPDATDSFQAIFRAASAEHGDPETGSITGEYFGMESMASLVAMFREYPRLGTQE